jgi:MoxR-like ATPase
MNLIEAKEIVHRLQNRLKASIVGRDEVIDLSIISLLSGGHMLLEDYPGSGKTTLAKALGESIERPAESEGTREVRASFRRV